MAQEIVSWCDLHLDRDERVAGTGRVVAMDNRKPVVIDLCDTCDKEMLQPIRELLTSLGRPFDGSTAPMGQPSGRRRTKAEVSTLVKCPHEDCEHEVISRGSLREHCKIEHGESLAVIEGRQGQTAAGFKIHHYCDQCPAGFTHPQGLSAHINAEHSQPTLDVDEQPRPAKRPAKKAAKKAG